MDLKKIIKNFIWKPDTEYQFSIPDSNEKKDNYISSEDLNLPKNIFTDISTFSWDLIIIIMTVGYHTSVNEIFKCFI